ncbi:hypothetical protein DPMN_088113 [Dreissena polymorpha]|uniref:Uncharacterized protein n=1 Tax=Dreissena polymorpha TaxID=45954 RepID=A0A9D4KUG2_DREPO|nr:hypothetical protein DPMN_088113 [Dreissena polymorpha]
MSAVSVDINSCSKKRTYRTALIYLSPIRLHTPLPTEMLLSFLLKTASVTGSQSPRNKTSFLKQCNPPYQTLVLSVIFPLPFSADYVTISAYQTDSLSN